MKTSLENYFTGEAAEQTRLAIADAGGNEVFFVGYLNEERIVESVDVFARGNESSAPALLQVAKQGDVVIHNHPGGDLRPSPADTSVASILGNDGVGFYIVDNDVSHVYAVVEAFENKQVVTIAQDELIELIGPSGIISTKMTEYEYREPQVEMLRTVCRAIDENKIALIEAGTGTGKTLAYLLPAIYHAVDNKERVVISTNTINLQEQLINKDLPFLAGVVSKKFEAALVKGRSNYVCRRKLEEARLEPDLFSETDDKSELSSILDWAKSSADGSKSDLSFIPRSEVWEKVQSESDTSLKVRCQYYDTCFFYQARRKAASADVLVANHHLLFSDLAVRTVLGNSEHAVLPAYERIIFDEAHNIEDVATSYFGNRVTYQGVQRILARLYRKRGRSEKGFLFFLSHKLGGMARKMGEQGFINIMSDIQEVGIAGALRLSEQLTLTMEQIYSSTRIVSGVDTQSRQEIKLRLIPEIQTSEHWHEAVVKPAEKLIQAIHKYSAAMSELLNRLEVLASGGQINTLTIDLSAQLNRLDAVATNIESILLKDDADTVRWLEVKEGYNQTKIVRLMSCPLDVAPALKTSVYDRFKSILMTSATLTVGQSFDYMASRTGLSEMQPERLLTLQLDAPFDYDEQTVVTVPIDIPEPNHGEFRQKIADVILECLKISSGRAFVLFTSYGLLRMMYRDLKDAVELQGHNLYYQGQENRHRLLERFKDDVSSVLFATDSYWEGVDVQGEALQLVIITKLPFRVPSEPVVEARIEALERSGKNAFIELTVPQAAIKFKQGFGRLIRRKTDFGAVVILDKRVIQKSYGRTFVRSLPTSKLIADTTETILSELRSFYERK